MKLLGWMHRKFRQNTNEPIKDFIIGHTCNCFSGHPPLDDPYYSHNLTYDMKSCKQLHPDHHLQKSFVGLGADAIEEEEDGDCQLGDSSAAVSELFHGFLAIGTFGSENNGLSDPSTPKFPNPIENITEKEDAEARETELKLVNDELERLFASEAKDDTWCNVSSGRTSHVSAGRSSHGSTINLGGRRSTSTVCPLQDFLFGSAIEMSETTALGKEKNRTSLGELFQRNKVDAEEVSEKEVDRSSMILVKEKLKKILHSSSSSNSVSTSASGIKNDSISSEKTPNKILHVFYRKIHPDTSASGRKSDKQQRKKKQKSKKGKSQCNPNLKESNGNRECWIKTDADYLVLEL